MTAGRVACPTRSTTPCLNGQSGAPDDLASHNGRDGTALESLAVERGIPALGERFIHVVGPFTVRGEDRDVGGGARSKRAAVDAENSGRTCRKQLDQAGDPDFPTVN